MTGDVKVMNKNHATMFVLLVSLAASCATAAFGQAPGSSARGAASAAAVAAAPATAAPTGPESTNDRFGDWTVTCTGLTTPATKVCEATQSIIVSGQGQSTTVGIVAIGRPARDKAFRLVVAVPVNIAIAAGVKLTADPARPALQLAVRTCVPAGCFADADLTSEILGALKNKSQPGLIAFENAANQKVEFQFSFRGFDPAYDALVVKDK